MSTLSRWRWLRKVTLPVAMVGVVATSLVLLYVWSLGNLTGGLSSAEVAARDSSHSLQAIKTDPVNAPHRLLQYGLQQLNFQSVFFLRLTSAIFALLFLGCFFILTRIWFGQVISILSTLLLAATPWLIIMGRSASAEIMLLSPLMTAATYIWWLRSNRKNLAWLLFIVSIAVSLYSLGGIWWISLGAILSFKHLLNAIKELRAWVIVSGFMLLTLLLAPLAIAIFNEPGIIKRLLLIPADWEPLLTTIKLIAWSVIGIFWRTAQHTEFNIDRLPLLNAAQVSLLIFGLYAMWSHARSKLYGLLLIIVGGILLAGVNNNFNLLIVVLPAISILVAAGLRYLYIEWRSIFPRNPLPRALALFLMVSLVALHLFYGVRYSLIAWPHTLDTRQVYMLK